MKKEQFKVYIVKKHSKAIVYPNSYTIKYSNGHTENLYQWDIAYYKSLNRYQKERGII